FRYNDQYQIQNNLTYVRGDHLFKAGFDVRSQYVKSFFFPTIRGLLRYATLQDFIDDRAEAANINKPLPGGEEVNYYRWWDQYYFVQDEWKARPDLTLNLGVRYEVPGNNIQSLIDLNERILSANNNNPVFQLTPVPKTDTNNFQPRVGFNWAPQTSPDGVVGLLTGGDRLVLRGGYARTHDYAYTNIALNIWSSFPFVAAFNQTNVTGAFANLNSLPVNPASFTRTIVTEDFHSPVYDSFSLEVQRELTRDMVLRIGYVGTKGSALFQTLDGNPRRLGTATCAESNADTCRVNQIQGVIRLRANAASSIYHSMQVSLEKRLSRGFSAGAHYTWSSFIDTASEIFNPSGAEVAVSQDSFDRSTERARSSFDRPHRFTGNFVYELPWFQEQNGAVGHILGGWQLNSFFTFQSGSPFTVLQGTDPAGALAGISGLVGNAIRPNIATDLPLGSMSIEEIRIAAAGLTCAGNLAGAACLFSPVTAAQRVGNAGRNILRTDGINRLDFGIMKNTRLGENHRFQLRADFFNFTNTRDFGVPEGRRNNANFLNQWGTNGGNRRVIVGLRYVF
ncbi:MAG TPA: hypothetical protein VG106_11370, partial [Vicinamibacterales bacterium]|nr:hypothetical protein [Vicinamibacterales bacterium]